MSYKFLASWFSKHFYHHCTCSASVDWHTCASQAASYSTLKLVSSSRDLAILFPCTTEHLQGLREGFCLMLHLHLSSFGHPIMGNNSVG